MAFTQLLETLVPLFPATEMSLLFSSTPEPFLLLVLTPCPPPALACRVLPVSHLPFFRLSTLWGLSFALWGLSPSDRSHFHLQGSPERT